MTSGLRRRHRNRRRDWSGRFCVLRRRAGAATGRCCGRYGTAAVAVAGSTGGFIESTVVASERGLRGGLRGRNRHAAQGIAESVRGLEALRRVLGDRHKNNFVQLRRQAGMQFSRRLGRLFDMSRHDRIIAGSDERALPGHHLVQ